MGNQSKYSLPRRGISVLCTMTMIVGAVFGNWSPSDVSASEPVLTCTETGHVHNDSCYGEPEIFSEIFPETEAGGAQAVEEAEEARSGDSENRDFSDDFLMGVEVVADPDLPTGNGADGLAGKSESEEEGKNGGAANDTAGSTEETENEDIWRQSVQGAVLTGDYAKDFVAVAMTQIGNKENEKNFIINKEGKQQYYSRYGQWYGAAYEEWSAMFVSFCAAYAGIPEEYLPREKRSSDWITKLSSCYAGRNEYVPEPGDLVFFSENPHKEGTTQLQNGNPAHVGIVINANAQGIETVEGNAGGMVGRHQYDLGDSRITGYVSMAKVMKLAGKTAEEEPEAQTEEEPEVKTEPEIKTEPEVETEAGTENTEAFKTVGMTVGESHYWIMGQEGTEHSWEMLNEDVIRIIDGGSSDMAEVEPVAAGMVYLIHSYDADGTLKMETFEVHVSEPETEKGPETENATETEATAESGAEIETEPETEFATETESAPETESETETEVETETATEVEPESETETEAATEEELESETETEAATEEEAESEIETEAVTGEEAESETETEAATEEEAESETETETVTEEEAESGTETEAATEEETESETETEAATEEETESETETETEIEAESETETEATTKVETETEIETEVQTEVDTETETEVETETETESETENESEIEPATVTITADDVILRAQPSVEAAVVGVVNSGVELELLDTVEAEEATWYKVNYHGEGVPMQETETETEQNQEDDQLQTDETSQAEAAVAMEETTTASEEQIAEETQSTEKTTAGLAEVYVRSDLADITEKDSEEETLKIINYEDPEVVITVEELVAGAIPENTDLRVVPLKKDDASTAAQYADVEAALQEKAESEAYSVAGFLAYDIHFEDEAGNEIEPNGEVRVSIDYKKAAIPAEVEFGNIPEDIIEEEADGIDVEETRYAGITILHLEENEEGQVTDIVDIGQSNQIIGMDITDKKEIQSAQFVADSFSTYTVMWMNETITTYDLEATGETITEERTLTHEKYVKKNEDGTYDLTLTVSGAVGSTSNKAKMDIVLVVDTSGSMQGANMRSTQNAVSELVTTLNSKANTIDARWKLVTFANSARIRTSDWTTGDSVNTTVGHLNGNGGTNYQDALVKAQTAVSSARADASSVVIFLTDGEPTYYLRSGNKISNSGNAVRGGGNSTTRNDYNGAIMGANALTCSRFYGIGIGLGDNVYNNMSGLQLLQNVADAVNAGTRTATNESSDTVSKIFNDIAADITTLLCSNVTVTDTLSEYVDIVANSKLKIAVYDGNGTEIANGNGSIELEGGQLTAEYDSNIKKLIMDFPDGYELKAGYTYKVTVTIEPNKAAETAYGEQKGYPNTGDAGTDAEGNNTSSGQPGFYSNEKAAVSYTYDDKPQIEEYPMPVVQLSDETIKDIIGETPDPTTQDLHHEKYIKSNNDENNTYDLTLTVSGKVGSETNPAKLDIVVVVDYSGSMKNNNKMSTTRTAINRMVDSIDPTQVDSRWNLITFNRWARNQTNGWVSMSNIKNKVNGLTAPENGTNYQAGLVAASEALQTARSDATKVVIFLTDGEPTYHLCTKHNGWGSRYDCPSPNTSENCSHLSSVSNSGNYCKGGGNETNSADYQGALMGAEAIDCDRFYGIGIGLKTGNVYQNGNEWLSGIGILNKVVQATTASERASYDGNVNELVEIFKKIAAEVTQFLCSDVTIQDTLSEYVEYIPGTPLVIEVKDKDGMVVANGTNTVTVDGASVEARYDETTRQIILDFPAEYELKAGYVYSVTVKITPTDKAYDEYIKTGYPHTGDEKTDAPDNTTSSNKPGFYSNAEATVTYTYQEKEDSSEYDDPVVQVYKSQLKIQKVDENNRPLPGAYFGLYSVENIDGTEDLKLIKSLASKTDGSIDFGVLPSGNYLIRETNAPTGYERSTEELRFTVSKGKIGFTNADTLEAWKTAEPIKEDDTYISTVTVTDKQEIIDFTVTKKWLGENGESIEGTEKVQVKLIAADMDGNELKPDVSGIQSDATATLTQENGYTYTWKDLKKYYEDSNITGGNPWKEIEYIVEEVGERNHAVTINDVRYHVEYEPVKAGDVITGYQITNAKWPDWSIVKNEYNTTTPLAGAEFELKNLTDDETDINYGVDYYGKSDAEGKIRWYTDSSFKNEIGYVPAGIYELSETKAPNGYSRSGVIWKISVSELGVPTITNEDGTAVNAEGNLYRFYNYKLYELPSTGGRGIFWYLISGMLLMMAAALILYKNKCREVPEN